MNLLLTIARIYLPAFIKKKKVQELFELTAEAFQSDLPAIKNLSYSDCLKAYAHFSKTKAEEVIKHHYNTEAVKNRLYRNAYQMGEKLRKDFRIKTQADVFRLSKILYKILKIEFTGNASGEVIIKRCFFSQFYTADVCGIISSLDEGVAAGLSAGGRLVFKERITEGKNCCQATFSMKDMLILKKAIVIGSGAAGATVAKELQEKFDVTVLEAGKPFRPFPYSLTLLESLRKSGLFFDEREIRWLFPAMQIRKTSEKMVLVNGIGTGGTTTIATGNALRMDRDLKKIGIDLSDEFNQISREIPDIHSPSETLEKNNPAAV